MIVDTFINSKILRDYIFIKGKINIDTQYFINQIETGIKHEDNKNFQTNVIGQMTNFHYFMRNEKFLQIILPFFDFIDNNIDSHDYHLVEAWGVKNTFTNYTKNHTHSNAYISGAIFLNKSEQGLYFEEIDKTISAEPGVFVLFSSFLKHRTTKRIDKLDDQKYSLGFNLFHNIKS